MAPSLLVLGFGMGACFSSSYDVALGDVAPDEAGSASGSLSAVQQLAAAIGSAVVTTLFSLIWLLPKSAPPDPH